MFLSVVSNKNSLSGWMVWRDKVLIPIGLSDLSPPLPHEIDPALSYREEKIGPPKWRDVD